MGVLYFLSSRTDLDGVPGQWDKLAHVGAYTVLGVLALRAFHGGLNSLERWPTVGALVLTVTYGVLDELHQGFVPGRDASGLDWAADVLGACLAMVLVTLLRAVWSRSPGAPSMGNG